MSAPESVLQNNCNCARARRDAKVSQVPTVGTVGGWFDGHKLLASKWPS